MRRRLSVRFGSEVFDEDDFVFEGSVSDATADRIKAILEAEIGPKSAAEAFERDQFEPEGDVRLLRHLPKKDDGGWQ